MEKEQSLSPSSTLIRIRNIPFSTTDEEFKNLFKDVEIKSAQIAKRRGKSKGYGFVELAKESDQKGVLEKLNGLEIANRKLVATAAFAPLETIVYVSNIPWSFKDEELKGMFKDLNVKSAKVVSSRSGRSRGFGFVEFESKEDQEKAIKLDQTKVEDRVITVRASNRGSFGLGESSSSSSPSTQDKVIRVTKPKPEYTLFVTNLPYDLDENDLKQIFNEFHVKTAKVPVRRNQKSKGFGFVEFSNENDQRDAMKALDQSEINGRLVTIKIAQKQRSGGSFGDRRENRRSFNSGDNRRENRRSFNSGDNRRENRRSFNSGGSNNNRLQNNNRRSPRRFSSRNNSSSRGNSSSTRPNREVSATKLHVSNLPYTVDDVQLASLFKDFKVKSAQVAKNQNGTSAGHGFVDFESSEEQQRAFKDNRGEIEGRRYFLQQAWK